MDDIPLIVIVGPTAIGKTTVSIEIAERLRGEIISGDSMQIYKYMDIGTAKPTIEEQRGIPHHLIDFIDPSHEFSVAEFQKIALSKIEQIHGRGKLPIVVGGTGLYINSLVYPMNFTGARVDPVYRQHLRQYSEKYGKEILYEMLQEIDPKTAERLHPNDQRRIIRALEIHHLTGKTMSEYEQNFENVNLPFKLVMIGLTMERQKLYERINQRVDQMIQRGLLDEVKSLLNKGFDESMISMQGLGYKELIDYLRGNLTLVEAIDIIKRQTRRFAKRQFTWFKRDKRVEWINIEGFPSKKELVNSLIDTINKKLSLN